MNLKSKYVVFNDSLPFFSNEEILIPKLSEGEILVKTEFTALCRSDINTFIGKRKEKSPTILGHEIVGRIVEIGPQAPTEDARGVRLENGQRITWAIYASDPNHEMSKKGIPQKASPLFKYGHELITATSHLHGGLSEYVVLRKNTPLVVVNEDIQVSVCSLINCSVATVIASIRLAGDVNGKNVLVMGAGMLGIIASAVLRSQHAACIDAVDISEKRLSTVNEFGVTQSILFEDLLLRKDQYDVVLDYSGTNDAMLLGLKKLSVGGIAIWVGATYPQDSLMLRAEEIIRKMVTIKGLHNYNDADLLAAVDFIEKFHNHFPFHTLIEASFTLQQVEEAFQYVTEHNPYRVGISFN